MRSLSTYINILKKKGLRYSIREGWKAIWPLWFTTNKQVKELIAQDRAYHYLKRRYARYIKEYDVPKTDIPHIIWICWLQGRDQAPELVQQCINSVEKYAKGFEIRLLTEESMWEYVSLPENIIRKYKRGQIPFTQFSDLLRVCLLAQHGGIWMDATVLLTDSIPDFVFENHLFMFRTSWLQPSKHYGSSWFLAASQGHPLMLNMQELLIQYWTHESTLIDYYLVHDLFALVINENPQCKELLNAIPYIQNVDVHTMMFRMFEPYTDKLWNQITGRSSIHKLTYKFKPEQLAKANGSIYEYILKL